MLTSCLGLLSYCKMNHLISGSPLRYLSISAAEKPHGNPHSIRLSTPCIMVTIIYFCSCAILDFDRTQRAKVKNIILVRSGHKTYHIFSFSSILFENKQMSIQEKHAGNSICMQCLPSLPNEPCTAFTLVRHPSLLGASATGALITNAFLLMTTCSQQIYNCHICIVYDLPYCTLYFTALEILLYPSRLVLLNVIVQDRPFSQQTF